MDEKKPVRPRKSRAKDEQVELSSGNVFADLGFRDADERLAKAKRASEISKRLRNGGIKPELPSDGRVRVPGIAGSPKAIPRVFGIFPVARKTEELPTLKVDL
jgi:hypothetical protein